MAALSWAAESQDGVLRTEATKYRAQGVTLEHQGDFQGAVTMLQKAIYLDPAYAAPHNDLGITYESLGRLMEAESEYEKALALNPGYVQAHTNLALLYEREGKKDLAASHWLQRRKLGVPNDPWTTMAEDHLVTLGYLPPPQSPTASPSSATSPAPSTSAAAPSPVMPPVTSSQERALQHQMDRQGVILREFESVTDPKGSTWGKRPFTNITGTQSR